MATSGDLETNAKADPGLQCLLCSETFRTPKTLDCAHTFCKGCLLSHARKPDEQGSIVKGIICPDDTCKKLTKIKTAGGSTDELVEFLPTNLAVMSLLEESQGQDDDDGTLQNESAMCGPCLKRDIKSQSSHFCINCDELQCSKCTNVHNSFAFSRGHSVITVDEMRGKKIEQRVGRSIDVCDVHSKPLEFYCKDHNKVCCSTCAIITHRGCGKVVEIADMAEDSDTDARFRPLKEKMAALNSTVNDTSAFLESKRQHAKCQFDLLPSELDAGRENIIDKFTELKKQVTTTASDALNGHFEDISARRCVCKKLNDKILSALHKYESYVANGSRVQKFIAIEKLNQEYACLQTEVNESLGKMKSLSFDIELTADVKQVLTAESVGKILIKTKEVNVEPILYGRCKLTLKKSIELPKGEKDESPLLTGLTFLPNGRLVAVDNTNCQLLVFNSDLSVLATHTTEKYPNAVTALNGNKLTVTNGDTLYRYKVNSSNQIVENGTFTGQSEYYSLSSMADDKYLVGVYDADRPACVVSEDGVETQLDINFKQKQYDIDDTRCCYSAATDSVILTELSTNTVYIYGRSDRTELEVRDDAIMEPRGVAVSNNGCIFVCCGGNDSIVQISPSGSIIRSTRCENMSDPATVCVNPEGTFLAVSNNVDPCCLQMYNIG